MEAMAICHDYDIVSTECIDNVIECCKSILDGTDDKEEFSHPNPMVAGKPAKWAKKGGPDRVDGLFGNVAYNYTKVD